MRDDFCVFILTHGRPDRVFTYEQLTKSPQQGPIFIVIDDGDKTGDEYRKRFGDRVITFSKDEIVKSFDEGDNIRDRRTIVYARNACFGIARQLGYRYFVQLDDDYVSFEYRYDKALNTRPKPINAKKTIWEILSALVDFIEATTATTIALSQGGDHLGGIVAGRPVALRRKAMNSFVCDTERPFTFVGRINEDVNTYTSEGRRGRLFFTVLQAMLQQKQTQTNAGGMTDIYLDSGTYIKSFYSVMYCPSSVKVGEMGDHRSSNYRIHHAINWNTTAPKILRATHRKGGA